MSRALVFLAAGLSFWTAAAAENLPPIPPIARLLPPQGAEVPAETLDKLKADLAAAEKEAQALKNHPLAPDAEVYLKAVRLAVENGEFFKPEQTKVASEALATARKRIDELKAGKPSWVGKKGPAVRGFRSAIDGSAQPYGVEIPDGFDFSKPARVYLWLHGRGDAETDLYFIANREKKGGQFKPPANTIQIHPFGRHCIGYKSAGETDVMECLAHAQTQYKIDPDRVALMGFSMGGAGAWHLGAHYAEKWAVVHPGAGFVDVQRYTGTDPQSVPPWESVLWGVYDVPDYVRNFLNIPLVAYSGEIDKQKAAADIMEAALKAEGLTMQHFIGPKMPHKYDPAVQKEVQAVIDAALDKGRDPQPKDIHFQTRTLRYPGFKWVQLDALGRHWEDTRVDASFDGKTVKLTTKNVEALHLPGLKPQAVEIDGQKLAPGVGRLVRLGGGWQYEPPDWGRGRLQKSPGLQGPMDDALLAPFLVVLPSKPCASPLVQRWVEFETARFAKQWRELFRGELRTKKDTQLTPDDVKNFHLILFGDAVGNSAIARLADKLPIGWKDGQVVAGAKTFPAESHLPAFIFPNPSSPTHYVVLNNGCSFREGHSKTNAQQNPKLPDWAIFDLRQPPDATTAGKVVAADFFDERWKLRR